MEEREPAPLGRRRDSALDEKILGATLEVLGEVGYDAMTMDAVAALAGVGKASLYRRWPSKPDLVRGALRRMVQSHLDLDRLPDTGSLRGDFLGVLRPQQDEAVQRKLRVLGGLGSFWAGDGPLAEQMVSELFAPWAEVNRALILRAVDRGTLPAGTDPGPVCEVLVAAVVFRGLVQRRPFEPVYYQQLLDQVVLPALGAPQPKT